MREFSVLACIEKVTKAGDTLCKPPNTAQRTSSKIKSENYKNDLCEQTVIHVGEEINSNYVCVLHTDLMVC